MRFERLLGPVTVVVEKFLAGIDGVLGDQDQSGDLADHHHLGHTVGTHSAVIDEPAKAARLSGGVDAILLALVLEIIHVAALACVKRVFGLQIFRCSNIYELPSVLYHEVSLAETLHS